MSLEKIGVEAVVQGVSKFLSDAGKVDAAVTTMGNTAVTSAKKTESLTLQLGVASATAGTIIAGYVAVGKALSEVIRRTTDYAKVVHDLGRAIGATAEESSRLIAAADDVGVSAETLKTGLIAAIRNGLEPTAAGLGVLADRYLSIQNPIERTKFLVDSFGRSGADLGPLLELGSAGIKSLGDEALRTGKILGEDAWEQTSKLTAQVNNLSSMWEGLEVILGLGVIPAVSGYLNLLLNAIDVTRQVVAETKAWQGPLMWLIDARAIAKNNEVLAELNDWLASIGNKVEDLAEGGKALGGASWIAAAGGAALNTVLGRLSESLVQAYLDSKTLTVSAQDLEAAIAALQDKHITITVTTLLDEVARQTLLWQTGLTVGDKKCFVAETPILTPDGERPIGELKAQDVVMVFNPEDGATHARKILWMTGGERDDIVSVRFSVNGGDVSVRCSPEHNWLLESGEWILAKALAPGARLQRADNLDAVVQSVSPVAGTFKVYNFEVDDDAHTYCVAGCVAHNAKTKAAGGRLSDPRGTYVVGERGWEIVAGGYVYSHAQSVMLAATGALAGQTRLAAGGFVSPAALYPQSGGGEGAGRVGIAGNLVVNVNSDVSRQVFLDALRRVVS